MTTSRNVSSITLTNIRTVLKAAIFNPKKLGPMKIIADVGSREYYELRAIEEIHAARSAKPGERYNEHINKALQLLTLARLNCESPQRRKKTQGS